MSTCPSIFELTAPVLPVQLQAHVASCSRCHAIRAAWEADPGRHEASHAPHVPEVHWPHPVHGDPDAAPAPGAIHSISGPEGGDLLVAAVIDVGQRDALVVPISDEAQLAGDRDVRLEAEVLGYPAMLEVWNQVRVLREQVTERLGQLDDDLAAAVAQVAHGTEGRRPLPTPLSEGPALVTQQDPRHRFREAEVERANAFGELWHLLFDRSTFGAVLANRRQTMGLELDFLSDEIDLERSAIERLERDQEDLAARVPRPKLEKLLQRLELPAALRLVDLVHDAVFANARQPPHQLGMVRARRRRGLRSGAPAPSAEMRQQAADDYVAGLLERLQEQNP